MARDDYEVNVNAGSETHAAMAAGAALGAPQSPVDAALGGGVYAVVPKGYSLESLEEFLPTPVRIKQAVHLHEADSFIDYVNEFGTGLSHVFFNIQQQEFRAVLDYHAPATDGDKPSPEVPGWCEHSATYQPRLSVEWQTWVNQNRKQMNQVDFARFLEENIPDIVEPNSADLLAVALTFEAKKSVEFSSGVRLANGQIQFQYDEVVRGTAQKGTMEVPEQFTLGIPIHVNGPAYRIPVRLRWRLQEGKVAFWYEIVRPHRFLEDALKEIRERIEEKTARKVLAGTPA